MQVIDSGGTPREVLQSFMKQIDGGWVSEIKVVAHSSGTLTKFAPAEGAKGFTISLRANVFINGTRIYFDAVKDLSPNDVMTFTELVF